MWLDASWESCHVCFSDECMVGCFPGLPIIQTRVYLCLWDARVSFDESTVSVRWYFAYYDGVTLVGSHVVNEWWLWWWIVSSHRLANRVREGGVMIRSPQLIHMRWLTYDRILVRLVTFCWILLFRLAMTRGRLSNYPVFEDFIWTMSDLF